MTPPRPVPHCTILFSDGLTEPDVAAINGAVARVHGFELDAGAYLPNCVCTSLDSERALANWLCAGAAGAPAGDAWPAALAKAGHDVSIFIDEALTLASDGKPLAPFIRHVGRQELRGAMPAAPILSSAVIVALRTAATDRADVVAELLKARLDSVGNSGHLIVLTGLTPANSAFSTAPNLTFPLLVHGDAVERFRAEDAFSAKAAARLVASLCLGPGAGRAVPIDVEYGIARSSSPLASVNGADAAWQAWAADALFGAPADLPVGFAATVTSHARLLSFECDGRQHVEAQRRTDGGAWQRAEDPAAIRQIYAAVGQAPPEEVAPEPPEGLRNALIDLRYML